MERHLGKLEEVFFRLDAVSGTNFVSAVRFSGRLDEELLRLALSCAQRRNPGLRVRIEGARRLRFTATGVGPIPLSVVAMDEADGWRTFVEREIRTPLPWQRGPLARVTLLDHAGSHTLVVTLAHVIGDGTSMVIMGRELIADYLQLSAGMTPTVTPRPPRPPVEDLVPRSLEGLGVLPDLVTFLEAKGHRMIHQAPLKLPRASTAGAAMGRSRLIPRTLPPLLVEGIVARARHHGVTVHSVLCAAAMSAVHTVMECPGPRTVACMTPINMRPWLTTPLGEEMGFYVSNVASFHRIRRAPLADQVEGLHRVLAATLEGEDPAMFVALQKMLTTMSPVPRLMARFMSALCPAAVLVTNMGRITIPESFAGVRFEELHAAAGTSAIVGTGITLAAGTVNGTMTLDFVYNEPLVDRTTAEEVATETLHALEEFGAS